MTDRAAARPGCAGFGWCQRGVHVMPGCHRQARGSRPASASAWFVPGHVCRYCGLPSPCQSVPGLPSVGFIDRRFRSGITAGYICGKRSAYLCAIAAWRVDNSRSFSVHRARIALSQVKALLRARPGNTIPSISPMCAQARRRFTQVIHMVVHRKACNTFSCRAGRQRSSVPLLARGGHGWHRPRRRAPDARRTPCRTGGPRPPAPACCYAHRDPAGRASSIRSSCPGSAAGAVPPACATTATSRSGRHRSPSTTRFSS